MGGGKRKSDGGPGDGKVTPKKPKGDASRASGTGSCRVCRKSFREVEAAHAVAGSDAPREMCAECYYIWLPCSLFLTDEQFATLYHSDEDLRTNVEAARARGVPKLDAQRHFPETEVGDDAEVFVTVTRHGQFLQQSDMRSQCSGSTRKQLRLGDPRELQLPSFQEPLVGWFLKDPAKPVLDVQMGVRFSIKSQKTMMPMQPQHVDGLADQALQHVRTQSDIFGDSLDEFFAGKGVSLDELKQRGHKVASAKVSSKPTKQDLTAPGGAQEDTGQGADSVSDHESCEALMDTPVDKPSASPTASPRADRSVYAAPSLASSSHRAPTSSIAPNTGEVRIKIVRGNKVFFTMTCGSSDETTSPAAGTSVRDQSDCDMESDVGSVATGATGVSVGKSIAGRVAKPIRYWIEKCPFQKAMRGNVDLRDIRQGHIACTRESGTGRDNDGARRLRRHLEMVSLFTKLAEASIPSTTWSEVSAAFHELATLGTEYPPIGTLVAMVAKRASDLVTSCLSAEHLEDAKTVLSVALPLASVDATEKGFDIQEPSMAPIASAVADKKLVRFFACNVFSKMVCVRIRCADSDMKLARLVDMSSALGCMCELPEEADPPELVVACLEEAITAFRCLAVLAKGVIDDNWNLDTVTDLERLYKASSQTQSNDIMNEVGAAVRTNHSMGGILVDLGKSPAESQKYVTMVVASLRSLAKAGVSNTLGDGLQTINESLKTYETCVNMLPQGMCTHLGDQALAKLMAHYSNLGGDGKPTTMQPTTGDLNDFQVMLQDASKVFPSVACIDEMMIWSAGKLQDASVDAYSKEVKTLLDGAVTEEGKLNAKECVPLHALLLAKGGLLAASTTSDGEVGVPWDESSTALLKAVSNELKVSDTPDDLQQVVSQVKGIASNLVRVLSKERFSYMQLWAEVLVESARLASTLKETSDGNADQARERVLSLSRSSRALGQALTSMRQLGDVDSVGQELFDKASYQVNAFGGQAIAKHRTSCIDTVSKFRDVCGGHPEGQGMLWHENAPGTALGWQAFEAFCGTTLLTIKPEELQTALDEVSHLYEQDQALVTSYGCEEDPEWQSVHGSLQAARATLSAMRLVSGYADTTKNRAELRFLTRSEVQAHQQRGIPHTAFPPMLLARMKAAIKLNAAPGPEPEV